MTRRTTRTISHQHHLEIAADAAAVWHLADDVARYPEWVGVTLRVIERPTHMAVGAVYTERTRVVGPITTTGRWTVVQHDAARLVQRHECADEAGPVKGMWLEMRVVPSAAGARFTLAIGCDVVAGLLTRPVAALLSRSLRRGNAENIRRFAALAETGGRTTSAGRLHSR